MSTITPLLAEKRWSVNLEKAIQQAHDSDEEACQRRYGSRSLLNNKNDNNRSKPFFVIDTPPPYPSGVWHIGAVAQYSMIDVMARSQRLLGKHVVFPWGVDRNGINVEFTVEKMNNGRKMKTFERADFLDKCKETIEGYTQAMRKTAKRVGLSCDFDKEYLTDSPEYRAVTQSIFVKLWQKGHIIEDLRPNLYDPVEGTTIADAEVDRISRQTHLVDVRWTVLGCEKFEEEHIIVSTTRPELICACGVILIHPEDERYQHLIGRSAILPIATLGRCEEVEIRTHQSVKSDFGSGILMVSSYGDQNDVKIFRELSLAPYAAIDLDGCMTKLAGSDLQGKSVAEARRTAIEILQSQNRIVQIREREQKIPVSEIGGNPVEIILLKEFYIRQTDMQQRIKELSDKIEFHPQRNKHMLLDWMKQISIDWPISRDRWYHTEIPLWYSEDGQKIILPPPGTYVQPWREDPPRGSRVYDRTTRKDLGDFGELRHSLGTIRGEEKVFDTWMDSSNSNLFVSGYLSQPDVLFDKAFPTSLRPQGKEIVRTWLYYTLLKSALLLDKPGFKHVWIDGLGMDPWGRKMSKSRGNGFDADSVLECGADGRTGSWKIKGPDGTTKHFKANKIGSECFRLWKACNAQVGDDFQINPKEIEEMYFGILTKLYNVARFASQFTVPIETPTCQDLPTEDRWILSEFSVCMKTVNSAWESLDIYTASQTLKKFGTGILASHWLEMTKSRLYNGDEMAAWTIHHILKDFLSAFCPICPFFCHHISTCLYGTSALDVNSFPVQDDPDTTLLALTPSIEAFNSGVWRAKQEKGLGLNAEIDGICIPAELSAFQDVLTTMHSLK